MAKPVALTDFEHVEVFESVCSWIWPDNPSSTITEPVRLTDIIRTCKPDDQWLMDVTAGADDVCSGSAEVRYIDLRDHPQLLLFSLLRTVETDYRAKATLIIREEYEQFIQYALTLSLPKCYLFTCATPWKCQSRGTVLFG